MIDQGASSFFPERIAFGRHSVKIPYTLIIVLLSTTGVGGTIWASLDFIRCSEFQAYKSMDFKRHQALVSKDQSLENGLKDLSSKLDKSMDLQHWQAADQAATRVCSGLKNKKYLECYKRILRLSMRRVKDERLPCAELNCED